MKRGFVVGFAMLFLLACSKTPQTTVMAPVEIVLACTGTQDIGETCIENCECLDPGRCIKGRCALVGLQEGAACFDDKQCSTGHCIKNTCKVPIEIADNFSCDLDCRDRYDGSPRCQTVCNR